MNSAVTLCQALWSLSPQVFEFLVWARHRSRHWEFCSVYGEVPLLKDLRLDGEDMINKRKKE